MRYVCVLALVVLGSETTAHADCSVVVSCPSCDRGMNRAPGPRRETFPNRAQCEAARDRALAQLRSEGVPNAHISPCSCDGDGATSGSTGSTQVYRKPDRVYQLPKRTKPVPNPVFEAAARGWLTRASELTLETTIRELPSRATVMARLPRPAPPPAPVRYIREAPASLQKQMSAVDRKVVPLPVPAAPAAAGIDATAQPLVTTATYRAVITALEALLGRKLDQRILEEWARDEARSRLKDLVKNAFGVFGGAGVRAYQIGEYILNLQKEVLDIVRFAVIDPPRAWELLQEYDRGKPIGKLPTWGWP